MNERSIKTAFYIIFIITALFLIPLKHLRFQLDLNRFFPSGDPEVSFYNEFRNQFHSDVDDETLIVGLENERGIFQKDFLEKVDSLTRYITGLKYIVKVYSLTNFNLIYFDRDQFNAKPLIHINQPEWYTEDSIKLFESEEYRNLLISKSGKAIAIAVFNAPDLKSREKDQLLHSIQNKINQLGFDKAYLTGKIKVERAYLKIIISNLLVLLSISILIISLLSLYLFNSIRVLAIPMITVVISVIWTGSLMLIFGYQPDRLSYWIPIVLAGFSGIHSILFINQHQVVLNSGISKEEAKQRVAAINLPAFFANAAAALIFFSMVVSEVLPLKVFGVFTGLGILLSYPVFIIIFHSFSDMLPDGINQKQIKLKETLRTFVDGYFEITMKHKLAFISIFICIILSATYFSTRIKMNGRLADEIPKGSALMEDFNFIEHDFYGTRRFELALIAKHPEKSFLNLSLLKAVETIENYLKDSCQLEYIISPVSLFKGANKAYKGGSNENFVLPDSQNEINTYAENIMQTQYADEMQRYFSQNGETLRISGRLPDLGAHQFEQLRRRFDGYFRDHNFASEFSYKITGSIFIMEQLSNKIKQDLNLGLCLFFVFLLTFGIYLFRSWRLIVVLSLAVLFSVIVLGGLMGAFRIPFHQDSSISILISLAIVAFNLVWSLLLFKQRIAGNQIYPEVLKDACMKAGTFIAISNIIILFVFLSFSFSGLNMFFNVGLLITVNLMFSLCFGLTILPILLILLFKIKK